ncbi:hypothetical protein BDV95DRAFT_621324 [Massariosphaeria phaeospora]|uniref:Uncharacterized protein n=1 Tax=Massariosphaeria phaeospora TaxID=100035 RepID=A0A7C8M525_9PLEO|nr:hypothetical protein BDV95DRAFT_621324 [Massariosphaeria phaeospora]
MRVSSVFIAVTLYLADAATASRPRARIAELERSDGARLLVRLAQPEDRNVLRHNVAHRSPSKTTPYNEALVTAVKVLKPRDPIRTLRKRASSGKACTRRKSSATSSATLSATPTPSSKPKGDCPEGKIPDPADGRPDKCISDDDKKCPAGQKAASRQKGSKLEDDKVVPECAVDDEPDHKCDKEGTFDYKTKESDKIKHSCRSTDKNKEDKTNKYKEIVDEKKKTSDDDKKKAEDDNKKKGDEDREQRKRGRCGGCFAIMIASVAFDTAETSKLTEDEIDGLVDTWDDKWPADIGFTIEDDMVDIVNPVVVTGTIAAGAGIPLAGVLNAITSSLKLALGGVARNLGAKMTALKAGTRAATETARNAARNSPMVQRMRQHELFTECVTMGALSAAGSKHKRAEDQSMIKYQLSNGKIVTIDKNKRWGNQYPSPEDKADQAIIVGAAKNEDAKYDFVWQTYPDNLHRGGRLRYESCMSWEGDKDVDNTITNVEVQGGCCTFYDEPDCKKPLFAMTNRQDGNLKKAGNDAITSFWCTFDLNCAGAPP